MRQRESNLSSAAVARNGDGVALFHDSRKNPGTAAALNTDRMTSRQIDRTFAVAFECHPAKSGPNVRPAPDPDRERWTGKAVLEEIIAPAPVEIGERDRAGNDLRAVVTGLTTELSIDRSRYPQADHARQGDRIQLDDLRRFEVTSVKRDGLSRVVLGLHELK